MVRTSPTVLEAGRGSLLRFDATDRPDTVDSAIKRGDLSDAGPFGTGHQVRVAKVEPVCVVDLDRPLQELGVDDLDGLEGQHRPQQNDSRT